MKPKNVILGLVIAFIIYSGYSNLLFSQNTFIAYKQEQSKKMWFSVGLYENIMLKQKDFVTRDYGIIIESPWELKDTMYLSNTINTFLNFNANYTINKYLNLHSGIQFGKIIYGNANTYVHSQNVSLDRYILGIKFGIGHLIKLKNSEILNNFNIEGLMNLYSPNKYTTYLAYYSTFYEYERASIYYLTNELQWLIPVKNKYCIIPKIEYLIYDFRGDKFFSIYNGNYYLFNIGISFGW